MFVWLNSSATDNSSDIKRADERGSILRSHIRDFFLPPETLEVSIGNIIFCFWVALADWG